MSKGTIYPFSKIKANVKGLHSSLEESAIAYAKAFADPAGIVKTGV